LLVAGLPSIRTYLRLAQRRARSSPPRARHFHVHIKDAQQTRPDWSSDSSGKFIRKGSDIELGPVFIPAKPVLPVDTGPDGIYGVTEK
jgi:hypothetical protein